MKLILASTSPRRRELVQLFGLAFHFAAADVDETPRVGESGIELVERLSRAKAERVARSAQDRDALVIAADTDVEIDGEILGKPKDSHDAERMLKLLRGRDHSVYSGLYAITSSRQHLHSNKRGAVQVWAQVVKTTVTMRHYTDAQIAAYVATGNPLDKAAAYAIQHNGFRPVEKIDGCYANVMGLPLCHLYLALVHFGIEVQEPAVACQDYLQISCPVANEILHSSVASSQSPKKSDDFLLTTDY